MPTALLACPSCHTSLKLSGTTAGKKLRCPRCGTVFLPQTSSTVHPEEHVLEDLLSLWQQHKAQGQPVSPAQLCRDHPELLPQLQRRIAAVQQLDRLAATGANGVSPSHAHTSASQAEAATIGSPAQRPSDPCLRPAQAEGELGRLGSYRVLQVLGQGGMGKVYQAEDTVLQRQVALKVMLPAYASDSKARQRFLREARAAAALEHDNIVTIHQVGEDNGIPFLSMPLLRGESLEEQLKREGKLPVAEVVRIGREMAEGLAAAHERGLIHRDIKPGNLWLEGSRRRVKILDFGLARPVAGGQDNPVTEAGAVLGTPAYMAPEQAQGEEVDGRADLFSLGCVLYQMSTGVRPFRGDSLMAVLSSVLLDQPQPPHQRSPEVPAAFSNLVMRLLAKERGQRPASAQAVAEELAGIAANVVKTEPQAVAKSKEVEQEPPQSGRSRGRGLRAAAVAVGLLLGLVGVLAAVFTLRTRDGTLVVQVCEPDVQVLVDGQEKVTIDSKKVGRVQLVPGEHRLTVRRGEEELHNEAFTLKSGNETVIDARWEPRKAAEPPARPEPPTQRAAVPASAFDRLERSAIPARELAVAGEGNAEKAPAGLVAVIGEAGMSHWRNVIYTGFLDEGKTLLTASRDGLVRWWDVQTRTLKRSVPVPGLVRNIILIGGTFDVSPDGKLAAMLEHNGKVVVRRTDTFATVKEMSPFWGFVKFSPNSKTLALVGAKQQASVQLLDVKTLAVRELELGRSDAGEPCWRSQADFSPDAKILALPARDDQGGELRFYDVLAGKRIRTVPTPKWVWGVIWHPSGKHLLAVGEGKAVMWEMAAEKLTLLPDLGRAIAITPDGHSLICEEPNSFRVREWGRWDAPGVRTPQSLQAGINSASISPGGGLVAAGDMFGGVCLVRLTGGESVQAASARQGPISQVVVTQDGWNVVRCVAGTLTWHELTGPRLKDGDRLETGGDNWRQTAFSALGRWAARVCEMGKVRVWDLTERTLLADISVPGAVKVDPGSLSAAGHRLVVARKDRSAAVVEVPSGKVLAKLPAGPEREGEAGLAISPDGRWVAVAGVSPGRLTVHDATTGKAVRELQPLQWDGWLTHRWPFFSLDGKKILCLSARCTDAESWAVGYLECWDAATGCQLFGLHGASYGGGPGLAIRPDSRQAAWAVADGTVRLIDLDTGDIEQTVRVGPPGGVIPGVAYAPDGRHLVTANGNDTAYVIRIPPSLVEVTDLTGSDWLDLLQLPADACEMRPGDSWVKRDGTWTTDRLPSEYAQMAFPIVARGGYDLKAQVSRREGTDCICFALPVGGRSVILILNGARGSKAGLTCVGGRKVEDEGNPTTVRHEPFPIGKKINITVSVWISGERAEIKAMADGVPPIRWTGPVSELSPQEDAAFRPGRLGVGVYGTRYIVHSLQLRRVDGVARVYLPRRHTPAGTKPDDR